VTFIPKVYERKKGSKGAKQGGKGNREARETGVFLFGFDFSLGFI